MYHIRIDYYDRNIKANQTLYGYDYEGVDEVIKKVTSQYLEGSFMVFSGSRISSQDIRRVAVYETEQDILAMKKYANDKEIEIIKKCEGKDNFNIIVSPFVFKNFCFGLVRDFYDNVLEENFILEDKISILNDKLKTAVIALEQYSCRDNWKSEEINGYFEEDSVFGSCGYSIAENALKNIKENKYGL